MSKKKIAVQQTGSVEFFEVHNKREADNLQHIANTKHMADAKKLLGQIEGPFLIVGFGKEEETEDGATSREVHQLVAGAGDPKQIVDLFETTAEMMKRVSINMAEKVLTQFHKDLDRLKEDKEKD